MKPSKIRRATGPRRVRSRKSFISLFLVLEIAYSARKGGPWGPQSSTNDPSFTAKSFKISPWIDFKRIFDAQKRHPKINDFWNPQKSTKMVESIDPWVPKLRFWHQKAAFWHTCWHCFFIVFPKWRKCEISEDV